MKSHFTKNIGSWSKVYVRDYFWNDSRDPYYIWLREVILQQTRVDQAASYFNKIVEAYPTINDLAFAKEDDLLKLWQGLGYYSRARNLLSTARNIVDNFGSHFPKDYKTLLSLKGIGSYTAAAIMSFSFREPYPTVDGNVIRLFCRYFGIEEDSTTSAVRNKILMLANEMIRDFEPDVFNQAIMDFGAEICTPKNPKCDDCPISEKCIALKMDIVNNLPLKKKKNKKRKRYFNYIVIRSGSSYSIEKRIHEDIWKGLYQFPLIESKKQLNKEEILQKLGKQFVDDRKPIEVNEKFVDYKQLLSHQEIHARYWIIDAYEGQGISKLISVDKLSLSSYAYPKIIDCYLKDNILI